MNLYAHQKKIIDTNPLRAGLFLGTGSGKTRVALLLARGDILVVAPKTQVEDRNWEREYKEILTGTLEKYNSRSPFPTLKPRLTVMSKEEFRRDAAHLPRFNTVIIDEAHTCLGVTPSIRWRNRQPIPKASQLYEALEAYLARTKPDRLYLATATIMRSPMTVWAAARLLGKHTDFYKFRDEFYTRLPMPGREVWAPKSDSRTKDKLATLVKLLGHIGRLEDFFDVPDQTFKTIYVELTQKQKDRIKDMRLEYPEPIVRVGKTHQIENGVLAGDEFSAPELFENAKIEKILELAIEFPKIVVFAKYRAQIEQIQQALTKAGYTTWTLTGDTKDRGSVIKRANAAPDGIFIAQAQISAGWELPQYPVMVFASMTYSFVDYDQALGRIQRANNIKKNLYIKLVVKGGVDDAVAKAVANKQDFNERLYATR